MNMNPFIWQFSRQISINVSSFRRDVDHQPNNLRNPNRDRTNATPLSRIMKLQWFGTHLQRENVVHGWSSARSPRVTAGMFSGRGDRRRACRVTQHSRTRVGRSVSRTESATQPSKEGCNRGHMIPFAPGAARSSGSPNVHHSAVRPLVVASYSALGDPLANATYGEETCRRPRVTEENLGWSLSSMTMHWHITLAKTPTRARGLSRALEDNRTILHTVLFLQTRRGEFLFSRGWKYVTWRTGRTIERHHGVVYPGKGIRGPGYWFARRWHPSRSGSKRIAAEGERSLGVIKILVIRHGSTTPVCTRVSTMVANTRAYIYALMYTCICAYARARVWIFRARRTHMRGGTADTHQP